MKLSRLLITLTITITLLFINVISAFPNEAPMGMPPPTGDWIVADHTMINNSKLIVNGSLTIASSGILELTNTTLIMNGDVTVLGEFYLRNTSLIMNTTNNSYGIYVESGALMHILDYDQDPGTNDPSVVTSGIEDGLHAYTFWVKPKSKFRIENSEIHECGRGDLGLIPDYTKGLFIETDYAQLKNTTINRTRNGIIFHSSNNVIYNCSFSRNTSINDPLYGDYGLSFIGSTNNLVSNNNFNDLMKSIFMDSSDNNIIVNNHFEDSVAQISNTRATYGIYSSASHNNDFQNNTAKNIYSGLHFSGSYNIEVHNYSINGTFVGIAINGYCDDYVLENIEITDIFNPESVDDYSSGIYFYSQVSHVNITNCTIITRKDSYSHGILWWFPFDSMDFQIKNCTIESTGIALAAHSFWLTSTGSISNVRIEHSNFAGDTSAFVALYEINNWTFINSSFTSVYLIPYITDTGTITILNNAEELTFSECTITQPPGTIEVNGVAVSSYFNELTITAEFYDTQIYDNGGGGIVIVEHTNEIDGSLYLDNCTIINNGEVGVEIVADLTEIELRNCNISGNSYHGILPSNTIKAIIIIENCTISDNKYAGLNINNLDEGVFINVYNSTISRNGFNGIKTWNSNCNLNIQNTEIRGNFQNGLEISDCYIEINDSVISVNTESGLNIDNSTLKLNNSKISENGESGLSSDYSNLIIFNSEIESNQVHGLDLFDCSGSILNNQIAENHNDGVNIYTYDSDIIIDFFIENNTIENNGITEDYSGIYIVSADSIIKNNLFTTSLTKVCGVGLKIVGSSWASVTENTFDGNFIKSLLELNNTNAEVVENSFLDCNPQGTGILCVHPNPIQLKNNIITAPGKYGIRGRNAFNLEINGNTISGWETGIIMNTSTPRVINNIILKNNVGIYIENLNATIKNNTIRESTDYGIYLKKWKSVSSSRKSYVFNNVIEWNNIGLFIEEHKFQTDGNIIKFNKIGLSTIDTNMILLLNDNFQSNDIGINSVGSNYIFNITDCTFNNNNDTIVLLNSNCTIYNSIIEGSEMNFILDDASKCRLLDTKMVDGAVEIRDTLSSLEQLGFSNFTIVDTDNHPVSEVNVIISDQEGLEYANFTTSTDIELNDILLTIKKWVISGIVDPNPYQIILSKPGFGTTMTELNFSGHTNTTLTMYKLHELITHIDAYDTPQDQGGSITLNWSTIPILNFGYYNIYVDTEYITSVEELTPITSIFDQSQTSIIVTKMNGKYLQNIEKYYFAVTVVDTFSNEDHSPVKSTNGVIPVDNIVPSPVRNLTAFDTPNDNGGSITITWSPSNATDFDYYELYYLTNNVIVTLTTVSSSSIIIIRDIDENTKILAGLDDGAPYFFTVLVYDINGNVNLTFELIGPVIPIDNLPPQINRLASTPSINETHDFDTGEREKFKIFMSSTEHVTYKWYLDGDLIENESDEFILLSMTDLSLTAHNLMVIVEDDSNLTDSLVWNFTVTEELTPGKSDRDTSDEVALWVGVVILIFIILILSLFGIRRTQRYYEVRKTVRSLPTMGEGQAISVIGEKRKQGDKYVLNSILNNMPEAMAAEPEKLFAVLSVLATDDISEVRERASKRLAEQLDAHPEFVLRWFRELQNKGVRPEIYLIISKNVKNKLLKNIALAYHKSLTAKNDEAYKHSLENTSATLKKTISYKYGLEMSLIYSTLNDFAKYRTISSISTSRPVIDKLQTLEGQFTDLLYPEVLEIFATMRTIANTLGKYEKVEGMEDKLSYLSQGITWLEEASRVARQKLNPPEREYFMLILNSWRNIISLTIRELRGRANLGLNLIGKEVVPGQETMMVMLELENRGRSIAERVLVELVPSPEYIILTGPQELGAIGQRSGKDVTFEIRPKTKEAFRVEFTIRYDDSERKGKTISFGDLVTFIDISADFQEIPNPYIVGTPIKAGSKLFVGRKDLIDFIQKNIRGSMQENIIVLIGHRRTGKTTLLQQLPIHLPKHFIPVYIDIQGIIDPGMDAFFYLMANEIASAMRERGIDITEPSFEQFEKRPSFVFEHEFLKEVYQKLGKSILMIMFDEFEELEVKVDSGLLDKNIFSYLRHLMQHTKQLAFIFTGSSRLEDLKTDYWSIMFNIALYKRISFLSETETKKLITEPVEEFNMIYDSLAIEKIYRLTSGHPYFTQLLCHALVNLHNSDKKNYITIQDVNGEIQRIIERGQMHFDFIWEQSTLMERLVMTALTRVLNEEESVTVSSIVNKLGEYGLKVSSKEISKTLNILISKDIVAELLNHTTTYEFKIDLIRVWLESTKNLDQVVENYRSGA